MPPLIIPSSTSLYIHPSNRPQPAATSPILSPASPTNPLPSPPPPSAILVTTPPPTSSSPLPPVAPFFLLSLYVDRDGKKVHGELKHLGVMAKFHSEQCIDLPEVPEELLTGNLWDYQSDRRGSGMGDDDKWSKSPGPLTSGRDPRMDNYGGNFRPGQGGNYGVLRNPRAQAPTQYAGGILSGPMQSLGSQRGIQWNTPDSERWQRATTFQKGLIPSPQTPLQIFDKALMEPTFCEMRNLKEVKENNKRLIEQIRKVRLSSLRSKERRRELQARRRMLGNIRLIGELYKNGMLTERIMHECINKLLGQYQNPDEEDIEALCKLMSTIGKIIDHPKAKEHIDTYFDMMARLSNNMKLSSGVRFMLKDAIDLRKNKWQQRRKVEGPKKIKEVHRDAGQERQVQAGRLTLGQSMNNSVRNRQPIDFAPRGSNNPCLREQSVKVLTHLVPKVVLQRECLLEDKPSILNTSVSERMVYGREDLMPRDPGITDRSPERSLPTSPTIRGLNLFLATLEDAVNDAPKAGEFLGRLLAKVISENLLPFTEIGNLIYEGGEEHGSLVESGLAAEVVGTILETIKSEKGDSVVNEIRASSSLKLEKFRHPDPKRSGRLDKFI
ncbi:eukaryotic translation initiation factor 4G [Actinidia rufa]|uniref:Eukaryotic translation initiation factor 4G n=1 Tax=Actinidia rufa TaxID=165716 RepID=A0A7J0EV83_9ERIC|nr:eukaryotic translation initiation factor 4G [Actinidia rufa]